MKKIHTWEGALRGSNEGNFGINKAKHMPHPKPSRLWMDIITRDKVEEVGEVIKKNKIIDTKVNIIFPKDILDFESNRRRSALIGRFIRVRPILKIVLEK